MPGTADNTMHGLNQLTPLETLLETKQGTRLPLTRRLTRLYGNLRLPPPAVDTAGFQ